MGVDWWENHAEGRTGLNRLPLRETMQFAFGCDSLRIRVGWGKMGSSAIFFGAKSFDERRQGVDEPGRRFGQNDEMAK